MNHLRRHSGIILTAFILLALAVGGTVTHLAAARPPKGGPKPAAKRRRAHKKHVVKRRRVRHKQKVARRRFIRHQRRLILRRKAGKIVLKRDGVVVRRVPVTPVVVVDSAADLVEVPVVAEDSGEAGEPCRVTEVVSCDTVRVERDGDTTDVRLVGVAAVETAGDGDVEAFLENLLIGEFVRIVPDSQLDGEDGDGAKVGYLYRAPDGLQVNIELIRQGYAVAADGYDFDHAETFTFYEQKARADGKGIWADIAPDDG
ncbi:MAG: thermonuclease family protein [Planctomycetota bacterium]